MNEAVKLTIVSGTEENQPEHAPKQLTVGERLATARSRQDLSVEQIAGQLKWSVRQIAEIEAGNYSVFPDMLTVRGFVRTYAKFLKIDSVPLVEELTVEFEKLPAKSIDRPKLDMPFPNGRMPWRHSNNPQKILAGLVLLFLLLLAAFVYRTELLSVLHVTGSVNSAAVIENGVLPPVSLASSEAVGESNAGAKNDAGTTAETQAASPAGPSGDADKVESVTIEKAPVVESKPFEQKNTGMSLSDSLALSFQQDSWIQVKRLDGSVVISHLYKAGSEELIGVNEPLNVVIGNAPGVSAKLRGQNLMLHAQDGSNVVNLSVK